MGKKVSVGPGDFANSESVTRAKIYSVYVGELVKTTRWKRGICIFELANRVNTAKNRVASNRAPRVEIFLPLSISTLRFSPL